MSLQTAAKPSLRRANEMLAAARMEFEALAAIGARTSDDLASIDPKKQITFQEWCEIVGALVGADQDRVMGFKEWCEKTGISEPTGRELLARGDGPPVLQMSPNRIGIRVCDHRAWLAARLRRQKGR